MEHVYREQPPPSSLAAHLRCLWVETTGDGQPAGTMRVLPDGCIDLVWIAGRESTAVGPATRAAFPIIPPGSTLVGARFAPGMAAGVLGAPADALADLDLPLAELWDRAALDGPRRFDDTRSTADGLRAIQELLIRRLGRLEEPGDLLVRAAAQTLGRQPRTPLDALAARVGLSERQLRRRFEAAIGYGPKTFQRIVRFQRWLRLARSSPAGARRLTDLAAAAGYADQAHLTREVTRLAGLPPTALLGSHEAAAP